MSACISRHGEYGSHIVDDDYLCTRCFWLDEDAIIAELHRLRERPLLPAALRELAKQPVAVNAMALGMTGWESFEDTNLEDVLAWRQTALDGLLSIAEHLEQRCAE